MKVFFAILAARLTAFLAKIRGGKSSSVPGAVALKICPDLVRRLSAQVRKGIVCVCGTNGKTTTNNLLCSALEGAGNKVICNKLGANMLNGVATAFALSASLGGKIDADYASIEVDEASTVKVFEFMKPNAMVITNLFRDQLDRYGEIDITVDLLTKAINMAGDVTLVLNADDPLCAAFGYKNNKQTLYYGISQKVLPQTDDTKEGRFCPICGGKQWYNYYHYSQLGDYECTKCDFKRPPVQVEATAVSLNASDITFKLNGSDMVLHYKGFYNIYNMIAVYAALTALGVSTENFSELLKSYKPQIGRMEEIVLDGKPVILNLAKNPAGFNQAIGTVLTDPRKKDVIIAINDNANDGRDVSWLWDVDFEKIWSDSLNTLTCTGIRLYDISLRFKYSDVKVDSTTADMKAAIEKTLKTDTEVVYILVNYSAMYTTEDIMLELKKKYGGKA
ncbi:MAG: Mur ligase family protein [Clostridia bacterium]|nr:Mur ligase family protein [Clostridia bacterium]